MLVSTHRSVPLSVAQVKDELSLFHVTKGGIVSHVRATTRYRRIAVFTYQSYAFQSRSLGEVIGVIRRPCTSLLWAYR